MVTTRKRGRPREYGSFITVRLPSETHDEIIREARRRGKDVYVADVVRERLMSSRSPSNFVTQNRQAGRVMAS